MTVTSDFLGDSDDAEIVDRLVDYVAGSVAADSGVAEVEGLDCERPTG